MVKALQQLPIECNTIKGADPAPLQDWRWNFVPHNIRKCCIISPS